MSTMTSNAVRTIIGLQSASEDPTFLPTLQLISVISMGYENGTDIQRYRAKLSDGTHHVQGMFLAKEDEYTKNSLVQVTDFTTRIILGRNVVVLLKAKVMNNPGARIGNPTDIEKAGRDDVHHLIPRDNNNGHM
jgi:hypothetical protein